MCVCSIADCVSCDLETVRCGQVGEFSNLGVRVELQAPRIRHVSIGLLEPCATRAKRAVSEQFDPDSAQMIPIEPRRRPAERQLVGDQQVSHEPNVQRSPFAGAAKRLPVRDGRAHRADAGDSVAQQDILGLGERNIHLLLRRCRLGPIDQLDAHCRRRGRSRSVRPMAPAFAAVTPAAFIAALFATTAWPSTRSRTTGRSGTIKSRSAAVGNLFSGHNSWFQPKPISQRSFGMSGRVIAQPLLKLGNRARSAEVQAHGRETEVRHVSVSVDEAWEKGLAHARQLLLPL